MKFPNNLAAIFLSSVMFVSCTDDFDMEFTIPAPVGSATINLTLVPLNPTEQKLRGQWFLRSMVTRDTVYNDSALNHNLTVRFTEFAYPGQTVPILDDYMRLFAKATPDSAYGLTVNETYQAPDSSTLIIYYRGGLYASVDISVRLQITRLELYNFNLRDSLTGKEWKFER